MLVTERGTPIPPTEIVARLHRMDAHLNLRFIDYHVAEGNGRWWALTWEWPSNDPRQQMVVEGVMAPGDTFDILGHLPLDCPVDQAAVYVEKNLRQRLGGHGEAQRLLDRMQSFNAEQVKKVKQATLELAEELVRTNTPTLFEKEGKRVPRVGGYRGKPTRS